MLTDAGFAVVAPVGGAFSGESVEEHQRDLVLLELTGVTAIDHPRLLELRRVSEVPVVVFSTDAAVDRAIWLDYGADDFVPAPLSVPELVARIRAVLRRSRRHALPPSDYLIVGELAMSKDANRARSSGRWIQLTQREAELLRFLMRHPGQPFGRATLHRRVWGYEAGDTSTVGVYIRRLRQKIELDPPRPQLICHQRGLGYYLAEDDTVHRP